jgi:uncharacterized protein (DUF952 family)
MFIYHITTREQWDKAVKEGSYQPESLCTEGFIHCSYEHQVQDSAQKYFSGQNDLVVLCIEPELLQVYVREESAPDSQEKFPHIYGALNLEAVIEVQPLLTDEEGRFRFEG